MSFSSVFYSGSPGVSSSASSGGEGSLSGVQRTTVDLTDSSWTLYDPDDLIDSVTHSDGFNLITWNELATGSTDYRFTGGSNHRSPRWYKLLKIGSTQVSSQDVLLFTTRLENDATVNDFNQEFVVGACFDPTSVLANTIDGSGGGMQKSTTGNPGYGTWQVNGFTGVLGAAEYGLASVMRGNNAIGSGTYLSIDSSDVVVRSGSRQSNQNAAISGTNNVYVMVGVGIRANTDTVSAGDQQRFKAEYVATTLEMS